jgi:general secretion pathway protein D
VLTKIKLEVSSAERLDSADTTGESPIALTTTNAETSLVLLDGARTILGGLYENNKINNKSTIPFLGEIPWLGELFTNNSTIDERREIILSITPYIIKKFELPDVDVATIWSGGEDNLKDGPNFGAFVKPVLSEVEATRPLAAPGITPVSIDLPATDVLPTVETAPAQTAAADEENVPTEQLEPIAEVGQPVVAELSTKEPAIISFAAPDQAERGREFSAAVLVSGVERLYSAPLFISYDPAMLELVSISEGDFLKQGGQTTIFSHSPNPDTGQVIVGYKQGPDGAGASGSGTLFNTVFRPTTAGETQLKINRVNFRNPDGVRLKVVSETAVIKVP